MVKYNVSVDAGNGGTKTVLKKGKTVKQHYAPSVRSSVSGDTLGLGADLEMQYTYAEWYGNKYIVGDDVLRISKRGLERHSGRDRYGNEMFQFLVAHSMACLGVGSGKNDTVDLTVFCPPGFYRQTKQRMTDAFLADSVDDEGNEGKPGHVEIKLSTDKKPRQWVYSSVTVWPEGLGGLGAFILDDDGSFVQNDLVNGEILVLDVGAYTTDILQISNGNFNPESLGTATHAGLGVDSHIRQPIVKYLKERFDDFASVTVDDIDRVIRLGSVSGEYEITLGATTVDIAELVNDYRARFAELLANNLLDSQYDGLRGMRGLILIGGGTSLVEDNLRKWYDEKILDTTKHEHTKKLHPVDMNAVGGLRLSLFQQKQKNTG